MRHGTRVVKWRLVYTSQARKDASQLAAAGLKEKAIDPLRLLERNPFETQPPYEKLLGDLSGAYSRRINIQHRLVYQVIDEDCVVKVIRMWSNYE
jgi:toxin YoeB